MKKILNSAATNQMSWNKINMPLPKRYFLNPYLHQKASELKFLERRTIENEVKNIVEIIVSQQKVEKRDLDGGLYVGAAGVAYMLQYLQSKLPGNCNFYLIIHSSKKEYVVIFLQLTTLRKSFQIKLLNQDWMWVT